MRRINWFRVLLIILGCYFIYILISQQTTLNAIQRENEAQRVHLEQLKQVNQELKIEHQQLKTPQYIEKIAREELGMVKPGEIPYVSGGRN